MEFLSQVNWWAQVPFAIVLCFLIFKMIVSAKKGLYQEVWSVISIIVAAIGIILIAFAIQRYFTHDAVLIIVCVVLLILLGIFYKLLDTIYGLFKVFSKLPIIRILDKIFGMLMGVFEVVLLVWAVFSIVRIIHPAGIEGWIMTCVENNVVMDKLYYNNYLYNIINGWYIELEKMNIFDKMGFTR